MDVPVYNMQGAEVGKMSIDESALAASYSGEPAEAISTRSSIAGAAAAALALVAKGGGAVGLVAVLVAAVLVALSAAWPSTSRGTSTSSGALPPLATESLAVAPRRVASSPMSRFR